MRLTIPALVLTLWAGPTQAVTLADQGHAQAIVAVPDDAIPAERTAARELATYLERSTGAVFRIVEEAELEPGTHAVYLGPTRVAQAAGLIEDLGAEGWVLRGSDTELIIAGGRPRGTLYGVYRFLEDHVGVRWWTPEAEHVPRHERLVVGPGERRGEPAFVYRDISGPRGSPEFLARNRVNGHFTFLDLEHGGRVSYGPPYHAHTFYRYVDPAEQFAKHPEFFSEIDGRRTHDRAQLCLSNDDMFEFVSSRLMENIESSQTKALAKGETPPRLFTISPNDWGGACECESCAKLLEAEGYPSGVLVRFVNRLAERVARRYPDVLLNTLAYYDTYEPPNSAVLGPNVALRLSALQSRDFLEPVVSRRHAEYRRTIAAWAGKTEHLRIWDYTVTFGSGANLPLPNWRIMQQDLAYYRDQGVEGMYVQHDLPIIADLWDLRLWLLMKLLEDPGRDPTVLIHEFTDGFYGAAAPTIRRYLEELERAHRIKRSSIRYRTRSWMYRYLTPRFLLRAQSLFDRAVEQVRDDPELVRRVQEARISLDRATVLRWKPQLSRGLRYTPDGLGSDPLDPHQVAERYYLHAYSRIARRLTPELRSKRHDELDREMVRFLRLLKDP